MAEQPESGVGSLPRLLLKIEKLQLVFRFTFAFHAREVRFEIETRDGFRRIFPETFSFHESRHDLTELMVQLDDLQRKPRLLDPAASRRDSRELVRRLLAAVPGYLDQLCQGIEEAAGVDQTTRLRIHQDVALLSQFLLRFLEGLDTEPNRPLRLASYSLRRRIFLCLDTLVRERVSSEYMQGYMEQKEDPVDPSDDPTESGFFHAMESGSPDLVNRMLVRMAERHFYLWLEGVCLDEQNKAFEKEDSPFEDREHEILKVIRASGAREIRYGRDLTPFLRRADRDCLRILGRLEHWFLRQYDISHASAILHHAAVREAGGDNSNSVLSWQTPGNHALVLLFLALPFLGAVFFYDSSPTLFDWICSAEIVAINGVAIWFLLYRFCWKRDLTFFHASVPRIGAGIIVGYLPVFLIDEVWDLASRDAWVIVSLVTFLGLITLLYIYVEIRQRLGDSDLAFVRARGIVLLGILQAAGVGLIMTSLVGRFMVERSWSDSAVEIPVEILKADLTPLVGELPRVIGVAPFYSFPSALVMMIFLSFFIGVFLQLMWEELPITEPI